MNFDFSKLKGIIVEKYENQTKFAAYIGMNKSSLNNKLNGITPFVDFEIYKIVEALEPNYENKASFIYQYFFTLKVEKIQQ